MSLKFTAHAVILMDVKETRQPVTSHALTVVVLTEGVVAAVLRTWAWWLFVSAGRTFWWTLEFSLTLAFLKIVGARAIFF